jgi:2-amino-4-hydroxy-6-hydroxymethyldihydropteridine diphosphokinase
VVQLETDLAPRVLLEACQAIERAAGRQRGARWASRSLDIDIIQFGQRRVAEPGLTIPHPELPNRDFWQRGLAEVQNL